MTAYSLLVQRQQAMFASQQTKAIDFRRNALLKLQKAIQEHEQELLRALQLDLNKSEFEAYTTEIGIVLHEIRFVLKNLHQWSRPKKVKTPLTHLGTSSRVYYEPYGVVLIISPWNYPVQLALMPLIGAIAAGNCAIIKPSELTPHSAEALAQMLHSIFPEDYVSVVQGGVEVSQALLAELVDYIFFTGSTAVGQHVMQAAAKQLIPVTLELGGKSPAIVHHDAHLALAAKRIAWGKFMNAGQTCVTPDYVYVHESVQAKLIELLHASIQQLYGHEPLNNSNYTRIVSERHYDRLLGFLEKGDAIIGGNANRSTLQIEPTVITNISLHEPIMQEEIFGPILPLLTYSQLDEALLEIGKRAKPLALYLFSTNKDVQQQVLSTVSFGGGCINDTVYHLSNPYLPFGGVGQSGIGEYHGESSFQLFSHRKSVMKQTTLFDLPFRYPHMKNGLQMIKRFLK